MITRCLPLSISALIGAAVALGPVDADGQIVNGVAAVHSQLVTTETKRFPPEKCKMMMEHLPEVTAELQKMEQANQPLPPELQTAITQSGTAANAAANGTLFEIPTEE